MILQYVDYINKNWRVILASSSPRRQELLKRVGLTFDILVSNFAEDLDKSSFPDAEAYNLATANGKLSDVVAQLARLDAKMPDLVICCDTIVVPDDDPRAIIEKAETPQAAAAMIKRLSGKKHFVLSALVLRFPLLNITVEKIVKTAVVMAPLDDAAIAEYVTHPEAWKGKSGAYGIQDLASCFISGIEGDFYNVVGFPLCEFCQSVKDVLETRVFPSPNESEQRN